MSGKRLNLPRATVNAFRRDLVRWYRRHHRKLPWRSTRDPYRIWVSEIMLQQTRVETVREYYRRWLKEFPTLKALARGRPSRVLKMWEGLGYYSRARNLHRAAQMIDKLPADVEKLREFPGIGRYTAGAIASIAFGLRAPVVDGNVERVFTRVFGHSGWDLAEALLPDKNCGDFNQALMELGALVCVPATPRCEVCPLRRVCGRYELPRKSRRLHRVTHDVVFAQRNGKVLLRQRPATGLLAGMWELPAGKSSRHLFTIRHTITNRQIMLRVFAGKAEGQWFTRRRLKRITMPAAHRRALEAAIIAVRRRR